MYQALIRHPPILLVDGFTPLPTPYTHIRRFYRNQGRETLLVPFRHRDMSCVETYASHIAEEALRLKDDLGVLKMDIVAYSMGGVATLYAMKRLRLAKEVRTLVTYGSPYHGAWLSRVSVACRLYPKTGGQLLPGSPFLDALHRDTLPEGPRYVSIIATRDILCMPDQCRLEGAENLTVRAGHWTFIWNMRVHRIILSLLI